jgi:hypothetical protein
VYGGVEAVGEIEGEPDGPLCALRAIRGDDDRLEHTPDSRGFLKKTPDSAVTGGFFWLPLG